MTFGLMILVSALGLSLLILVQNRQASVMKVTEKSWDMVLRAALEKSSSLTKFMLSKISVRFLFLVVLFADVYIISSYR